jgi:hypothetical protein
MSVKLTHLQLIYGIAGAREQFEDLTIQLIRSVRPKAETIRIVKGDGGIDAHEGSLADKTGIDVYQMKFFPIAIGESQKAQIRDSFTTARKSDKFKAKTWTLCIPIDMSLDEKNWFDAWKDSQASSGIEISLWSGTHLEGILFERNNEGIKEAFFKEEYLTQIRDSHQMLLQLLEQLSPLVLTPILQPIRPLKAKCLAEPWAVVELVFPIVVRNANGRSVHTWTIDYNLTVETEETLARILKKQDDEWVGTQPWFHMHRGIVPGKSLEDGVIKELQDRLTSGSPPLGSEPLSLDAAMAFVRVHTPPARRR